MNKQIRFYGDDGIIKLKEINGDFEAFSKETTKRVISFINEYVNGAIEYNENNNVILSANLGRVSIENVFVKFEYSLRSNDMELRNKYLDNLKALENKNNVEVIWEQELAGIEPNYENSLANICDKIYKSLQNENMERIITQGVVEGGFFKNKIKDLEYICIGPNTYDVHSPKERVSIKSMEIMWDFIKKVIENK